MHEIALSAYRCNGEEIHAPGTLLSPLLTPEEIHLTETAFHLHPGDALLLYTDGITEARLAQGHPMFGDSALANTLAATHGLDARTTVAHLHATVATHTHGKTSDDTALMLLRVIA